MPFKILRLLIGLIVGGGLLAPALAADPACNIVVILADDLGVGDLGCYNDHSKIPTPHLDRLASQGMRFTNAYSAAAVCVPSRYSLLTGRHAHRGEPLRWSTRPTIAPGVATIGSVLQSAGYETACIGKWHAGFDGGVGDGSQRLTGGPLDRGFDHFFGQHGSLDQPPYFYIQDRGSVQPATETTADQADNQHSIIYQGKFWRGGKIAPNFRHEEVLETYAGKAIDFLNERGKQPAAERQPFFLYLALTAPHGPWLPAKKYQGQSKAGPLGDFVVQVDDVIGRVLAAIDAGDLADNTLVLLSSDNGPLWFDPDVKKYGHDSSGGFRGRKGDIWEGGIRMPLIARWPGKIEAGKTSTQLASLVDLMATTAAAAGSAMPPGAGVDSINLLPALLDPNHAPIRDSLLLQSLGPKDLAIRQGPWKYIPWLGSGGFLTKPKRRPPAPGEPTVQLYNLETDPGETKNLAAEHPEIVKQLAALLQESR